MEIDKKIIRKLIEVLEDLKKSLKSNEIINNDDPVEEEVSDSKTVIKSPIVSMSHPLNSYGPETVDILNSLGITCGFRSNMERDSLHENGCLLNLQLPREDSAKLVGAFNKKL